MIEAVLALLEEGEGFTGLGVQRIADRAGIARSTFYVHFPDKTVLLMRATEQATAALFSGAEAWVGGREAGFAELRATLESILEQHRRHASVLLALTEVAAYEPEVAAFWRERVQVFVDLVRDRLEAERAAGRVPADVECAALAAWMVWGVERTVFQHVAGGGDPAQDARLARGMAQGIWAGMGGAAA